MTITSGESSWVATLGADGPIVSPKSGYPDAQVLRRKSILKLIEAVPRTRFEELKGFIAVPNVEKAEASLREAVRLTKNEFDQCSQAFAQAKDSLDGLWVAEGKPGADAISWAASEAKNDVSELKVIVQEIDKLHGAFVTTEAALASLDIAITSKAKTDGVLASAEGNLKAAEADQKAQSSELVKLLEAAKLYIEQRLTSKECPVCESSIDSAELIKRLTVRLSDMEQLKDLTDAVRTAMKEVESQTSVLGKARKDFCNATRTLGQIVQKSNLSDLTTLNVPWGMFTQLMSGQEPSVEVEDEARKLWSIVVPLRLTLKERKDAAQKTVNHFNAVKGHVDTYQAKQIKAKGLEASQKRLQELYDISSGERKAYVEEILEKISGSVEKLYEQIHPDEGIGKIRFYLKPNTIGSLEFDGNFQTAEEIPPQAYYSESHLDTLGICVFLALAKHFKTDKTIIVLDDVLTSIDAPHLDRFMKLLHAEAATFKHVIVTTHYRPWRDRYRWGKGPIANTQMIELGPWTLETGLNIGEFLTAIEELRNALSIGTFDRQVVASKAGIILESLLDFLTLKYRCSVPRNPSGEHTLGELEQGIDSKLAKVLVSRKATTKGTAKAETALKPLIDSATEQGWVRNTVGCHFNSLGSEVTDGEVKAFGNRVLGLADSLICPYCHNLPTKRPSGSFWQCRCGELELVPLVYPGAHPGTVDDEA